MRRAAVRKRSSSSWRWFSSRSGSARTGRDRNCVMVVCLALDPAAQRGRRACAHVPDSGQLGGGVGDDAFGGVGGGGRAQVGDQVEQRVVGFVADALTIGVRRGGDRSAQCFVGEGQQVLDAAAAASQHDHLDVGVAVQFGQRFEHLRTAVGPAPRCSGCRNGLRASDSGPQTRRHVRPRCPSGDQPDRRGQERQRSLEPGIEQSFGCQQRLSIVRSGPAAHRCRPRESR